MSESYRQIGWISKSTGQFANLAELTAVNVMAPVLETQNPDWEPVFVRKPQAEEPKGT